MTICKQQFLALRLDVPKLRARNLDQDFRTIEALLQNEGGVTRNPLLSQLHGWLKRGRVGRARYGEGDKNGPPRPEQFVANVIRPDLDHKLRQPVHKLSPQDLNSSPHIRSGFPFVIQRLWSIYL